MDFESLRRQESIFTVLNLLLIAALLLTRMIFRNYMGGFPSAVVATLVAGFVIEAAELILLQVRAATPSVAALGFSPGGRSH